MKYKVERHITNFLLIIIFINVLYCLYRRELCNIDINYWILSLTHFFMLLFVYFDKNKFLYNPAIIMYMVISIIRFQVIPFAFYKYNYLSTFANTYSKIDEAINMMVFEMIISFAFIFIYTHIRKKRRNSQECMDSNILISSIKLKDNAILYLTILLGLIIIIKYPALLGSIDVFSGNVNDVVLEAQKNISGAFSIIWSSSALFITLICMCFFKLSYNRNKNRIYILISIFVAISYILLIFISGVRISRWEMLLNLYAIAFLLLRIYRKEVKVIILSLGIFGLILLGFATFQKAEVSTKNDNSINGLISTIIEPTMLDTYFSGPVNINTAIYIKDENKNVNKKEFFINDLFVNFPGISSNIDRTKTTNYIFNRGIYGYQQSNDQIIPFIGQTSFYVGSFLCPFISVFFIWISFFFNEKSKRESVLFNSYIYSYFSVLIACFSCLNFTILASNFYINILVPWILLYFNKKIRIK